MANKPTYEELWKRVQELEEAQFERKRAEEELRQSEKKYRDLYDEAPVGYLELDSQGRIAKVNRRVLQTLGYTSEEMLGRHVWDFVIEKDAQEVVTNKLAGVLPPAKGLERTYRRKDGTSVPVIIEDALVRDENGRIIGNRSTIQDITERKRAEVELSKSEERYRDLYDEAPIGYHELDTEGRIVRVNRRELEKLGYTADEMVGTPVWDFVVEREESERAIREKLAGISPPSKGLERTYRRKNGTTLTLAIDDVLLQGKDGRITGIRSALTDISDRKRAEEALQALSLRQQALLAAVPDIIMEVDQDKTYTWANQAGLDFFGEDVIGKEAAYYFEAEQETYGLVKPLFNGNENVIYLESWQRRKDGESRLLAWWCRVLKEEGGNVTGALSSARDITDRKRAEEEVRASEEKLKAAFEGSHDAITLTTKDGQFLDCNQRALEMFGLASKEGFMERRPADFSPDYQPDGRKSDGATLEHVNKAIRERFSHFEWLHQRSTGETFPTEIILTSYQLRGEMVLQATIRDISERKKAEEEKDKLQVRLLQAQKMESVGRLAGGVAHDFNNMLGIIIGNAEIAALQVNPADPLHQSLQEILKASQRSADTVRQLLAFARKQTISPKVLDLNDTVSGMIKMLQRLIGENIDLAWLPGHGLWPVKIDPSQVNQILANLAVNARDAIAGVGKVTIETDNVTLDEGYCADHKGFLPGQYVLLVVSDSGAGMPKEALEHLFEPFFTTKEVGKGTGLGLSMVYGIVKQNRGFVNVYSEPGKGTTIKIYLPRFESESLDVQQKSEPKTLRGGTETVLMVEDEASILRTGKAMLNILGYKVLTASTPGEALRLVGEYTGAIHLVFTDVVMPEMNGLKLVEQLKASHPGLKYLYMSGYAANGISHRGVLDESVNFIQKPFSMTDLAVKLREVLDEA